MTEPTFGYADEFAELLQRPSGDLGDPVTRLDYAMKLGFSPWKVVSDDFKCISEGSMDLGVEKANFEDGQWRENPSAFVEWEEQFLEQINSVLAQVDAEYSNEAVQECRYLSALPDVFLVAVPVSSEEGEAWAEYAALPEFGVSRRVERGMRFLNCLCFYQVGPTVPQPAVLLTCISGVILAKGQREPAAHVSERTRCTYGRRGLPQQEGSIGW